MPSFSVVQLFFTEMLGVLRGGKDLMTEVPRVDRKWLCQRQLRKSPRREFDMTGRNDLPGPLKFAARFTPRDSSEDG